MRNKHPVLLVAIFSIMAAEAVSQISNVAKSAEELAGHIKASESEEDKLNLLDSLESVLDRLPDSLYMKYAFEIGSAYRELHHYNLASDIYERLAKKTELSKDLKNRARALYYQGVALNNVGIQNRALESLFQALTISDNLHDNDRSCLIYTQIGIVKKDQGLLDEAIAYFDKALEIAILIEDESRVASLYNNIGSSHKLKQDYARAKEFFLLALEINKRIGNEQNLSYNYNNIANIYEETGDLESAIIYHDKSIELKKILRDKPSLAVSYSNIALVYLKMGKEDVALNYVEQGLELAQKYQTASILPILYGQKALLVSKKGDFKSAFEIMQRLEKHKDSIASADKQSVINELEARYERQLILNENEILKKDIEISESELYRKDAFLVFLIVCVAMLLLVLFMYYKSYKRRSEANKKLQEQNDAIKAQKDRIEVQKRRIEESTLSLEQARKDKEVFFSTISHDMRGPISAISSIVKMLKQEELVGLNDELQVLDYSSRTLNSLVEDILDFSNLESGRLQIEQKTFNIIDLLNEIVKSFEFISNEKEVDLITDFQVPNENVLGDPRRISQVVFNLLGNAFKFTREGYVKLTLRIEEEDSSAPYFILKVIDTGVGIPASKLEVIFNKFEQANNEIYKDFGGSGLGLYISKQLIEQMGGLINVTSKLGEGTEFTISLNMPIVTRS
ncbi:MAG: tetratricopeptide repeat-containing sensor histidine kinase [Flavobacteriales bacterium]